MYGVDDIIKALERSGKARSLNDGHEVTFDGVPGRGIRSHANEATSDSNRDRSELLNTKLLS